MLLLWSIIEPQGPSSNLSSVRFSSSVRIRSIRIFPTGAKPFQQQPDIIAETSPTSFYLDVYFNAQQIGHDGKAKQKPSNALVQTSIAYQGGSVEFAVDQDRTEFATRLMIIRGDFEKLSLAVYGSPVTDTLLSATEYDLRPLPAITMSKLPLTLDPASSLDPTSLAQSLLTLTPKDNRPSLPLIARLMFCLKPSNEDWDEPYFPHLYSDLDTDALDFSLEKAAEMTARPVSDEVDESILRNFAINLADSVYEYNDEDAYYLAKLMSQCAPQHPKLVQLITENIDVVRMYTEPNLDRPTLLYLLDASASIDVSRQLNNEHTVAVIESIRDDPSSEEGRRRAASRLAERIKGWDVLEDAITNTQAQFAEAALLVKDVTAEENSFGIWLENMIGHPDIVERLGEIEHLRPAKNPTDFWQLCEDSLSNVSHDDFIQFVRACIGVAAVVAVYAWADSVPVEECRERTLAVIKFWQNVEGYRQIINHFMVMRQMAYRLESMLPLDDDLPSQAGVDAEYILKTISQQPASMLRPDIVKVVQNLQMPLNYISNSEVADLMQVSQVAKGGLSEALRVLTQPSKGIAESEMVAKLRLSISVVQDVMRKSMFGDKKILEALWNEGLNDLPSYLIQHLSRLSELIQEAFGIETPFQLSSKSLASLFWTCEELLSLLQSLQTLKSEPTRDITVLAKALLDVAVYSDVAPELFRHDTAASSVALITRKRCISLLRDLLQPTSIDAQTTASAKTTLKVLFTRTTSKLEHNTAHYSTQVFWLLDEILPDAHMDDWDEESDIWLREWTTQVIPDLLSDLHMFFEVQENANKLNMIKRLRRIDVVDIGIADWLVARRVEVLSKYVGKLKDMSGVELRIAHWQVTNSLELLVTLIEDPSTAQWVTSLLMSSESLARFVLILRNLLDLTFCYELAASLAVKIALWNVGDRPLKTALMGTFLRAIQCGFFDYFTSLATLLENSRVPLFDVAVAQEFGEALEVVINSIDSMELDNGLPFLIFRVLEQVTPMDNSSGVFVFPALAKESLAKLITWLESTLQIAERTKLQAMKMRWSVSGKPRESPVLIASNYTLDLSLNEWESTLVLPTPVPSTPTRKSPAQSAEMLGMITVSPPNALLRSPEVKGLTKIYSNNDFRQLRQSVASRQNTSRMPSRHVDDFEQGSSIAPLALNMPVSPTASITSFNPQPHRPLPDLSLPPKPTMFFQ